MQLGLFDATPTNLADSPQVCVYCKSAIHKVSPQGWECTADYAHRFWVQQGLGIWTHSRRHKPSKIVPLAR